jgi:hypothetical protein
MKNGLVSTDGIQSFDFSDTTSLNNKLPLGHKPFLLPQEQYNMVLVVSWFYHSLLKKCFPCFDVEATEEAAAIPYERLRHDVSRF